MGLFSELRKRAFIILIGFVVFYVAFAIFYDSNEFIKISSSIQYIFIIPILIAFTTGIIIKSLRQWIFLKHLKIEIPMKQNIVLYFAGLSMLFTPAGMGEIIKSHFLSKNYNQPIPKTMPLVLVERYHDALAVFSIITIFSILTGFSLLIIPLIVIGIVLFVSIILVRDKKILGLFQRLAKKINLFKNMEDKSIEFNESLVSFSSKKILSQGWLLSMAAWFFDGLGIFLCFQAFGLDFDFFLSTLMGLSSVLFGAITLIPGGVGVTEVSFVELLKSYGVESSVASALALFFRLLSIWFATCLGIIATRFVLTKNNFEKTT